MRSAAIKLLNATINTLRGLSCGVRLERAIRQEVMVFIVAVPVGAYIAPDLGWYAAMIGSLLILLAVELLNTAIEKLADRVTREHDPQIDQVVGPLAGEVRAALEGD